MRDALENLLYRAQPNLFALRYGPVGESSIVEWGIEHGDGWFAITAALAEVIAARAPQARVVQCKAKLAAYRFYLEDGDAFCAGAIRAAEGVASRVSELSGRRGRPVRQGTVFSLRVRAPAEAVGWNLAGPVSDPPASPEVLRSRHPEVLADAELAIPTPCLDLVDGWLGRLPPEARLVRLDLDESAAFHQPDDGLRGALAFLGVLGRRVDRATGCIGPVDDCGQLLTGVSSADHERDAVLLGRGASA